MSPSDPVDPAVKKELDILNEQLAVKFGEFVETAGKDTVPALVRQQSPGGSRAAVASAAARVAAHFAPLIDQGYDVVAITASCALMMKFARKMT